MAGVDPQLMALAARIEDQAGFLDAGDAAIVIDEVDRAGAHQMKLARDAVSDETIGIAERAVKEHSGIERVTTYQ